MKIVALIQDGHGRLHFRATCAPDLVRRDYSAETGRAELLWCGVPPAGTSARQFVEKLRARFGVSSDDDLEARPDQIIRALIHATITEPGRRQSLRRVKGWWRRIRYRFGAVVGRSLTHTASSHDPRTTGR